MSIADGTRTDDALPPGRTQTYPDSFWRSLKQLNAFRLFLALFVIAASLFAERLHIVAVTPAGMLLPLGLAYLVAALWFRAQLRGRRIDLGLQLVLQLLTDIVVITAFKHFGGGHESGLGLLLTVPLAAAGLHPRTRVMLSLASLASIAVLLEQWAANLASGDLAEGLLRAALLSVGFFALAGISHVLAKGALTAARIAGEKSRQAADLERISGKVIQELPNGVMVLDREGRVLLFNAQAEALVGCPLGAQQALVDCQPDLARAWRNWLAGDGPDLAMLVAAGNGRRLRARLLALGPARDEGAVVVIEDLSEMEREAMHMKLAALGRLTANLAHEIRNPLSAINHASQLLREDRSGDSATDRLTRIIEDNVGRLNYLVEDVLSLSRRDRGNREAIPLGEFLPDFVAQFQQVEQVPAGIIHLEVAGGCRIAFDRMHLHQILWNLCRNAVRHCSRQPGSIRLKAGPAGDTTQIDIYNDGPAIPAEMRMRLFEPFHSTDKAGTGLGLYIALELAEANGGQLRCLEPGPGVLFRLTGRSAGP